MRDRGKAGLLAGLLVVWAVSFAFVSFNQDEPQRAPLKFKTGQPVAKDAVRQASGIPKIVRPQQKDGPATFVEPKNVFAALENRLERKVAAKPAKRPRIVVVSDGPLQGPQLPPTGAAPPPPPPPSPEEIAAAQARQQREQALQQARQLMAQYRYLGYLTEEGGHRGFLGKDRELYVVAVGELMEGRLRVKELDPNSVKLMDMKTSLETVIPLTKDGAKVS
jgi:hypothetical protein